MKLPLCFDSFIHLDIEFMLAGSCWEAIFVTFCSKHSVASDAPVQPTSFVVDKEATLAIPLNYRVDISVRGLV